MRFRTIAFCSLLSIGCTKSPERDLSRYLQEGKEFLSKKDYSRAILKFKNASKAVPQEAEPYYQLGLAALAMGDHATASDALSRAIGRNPKHLDALLTLAELYSHSIQDAALQESARLAERALALAPNNEQALNILSLIDMRSGKVKDAKERLESILKRSPQHVESAINLARAHVMLNDRKTAEAVLYQAASSTNDAKAFFAIADFYRVTGDISKAEDWYTRGLLLQPDHPQARAALGKLQVQAGRQKDADSSFALLAKNPDHRFRFAYATHLFESGRKDTAIDEFTKLLKENPEDRDARTNLINAYLASGRAPEAEKLLTDALERNPKDTFALLQRARVSLSRKAYDAAEKDVRIVLADRPDSSEAHFFNAQIYRFRHSYELQQRELNETVRLDPNHSLARRELSQLLLARNDPKGALSIIDSAPEGRKLEPMLRVQRIWALLELNRLGEARSAIDALQANGNPEVLLQESALGMRQRDYPAARLSAQRVLAATPADVRALELIMRSSLAEKRPVEGLEFVRRHATQNGKIAVVQLFRGQVELMAGNRDQARGAFELAKSLDPNMTEAEWNLIDLDITDRRLDSARQRVAPLLKGSTEPFAITKLALIEQTGGNYRAAGEHYRRILQTNPHDVGALNSLAYILAEFVEKPTEALRYAQTAKELAPNDAAVDDTLGWTYYRLNLFTMAIRHLELAVKREPNARRQAHLAMAYAKNGDRVRANETLQTALRTDPRLPEISVAQKVLADSTIRRN